MVENLENKCKLENGRITKYTYINNLLGWYKEKYNNCKDNYKNKPVKYGVKIGILLGVPCGTGSALLGSVSMITADYIIYWGSKFGHLENSIIHKPKPLLTTTIFLTLGLLITSSLLLAGGLIGCGTKISSYIQKIKS